MTQRYDARSQCHGKTQYPSEMVASNVAKARAWGRGFDPSRGPLQAYDCPHCDSWHVGRLPQAPT